MSGVVRRVLRDRWFRVASQAVAVIAAYYMVPIHVDRNLGIRIILTTLSLIAVGIIVTRHVHRGNDPLDRLFTILLIAIATLAFAFYTTAMATGQFDGLETRTDALYFTVITMTTIGYGDIHPTGQLARILVMVAVVFQFLFLTALISTIAGKLSRAGSSPALPQDQV